jgi:hypothetical protein
MFPPILTAASIDIVRIATTATGSEMHVRIIIVRIVQIGIAVRIVMIVNLTPVTPKCRLALIDIMIANIPRHPPIHESLRRGIIIVFARLAEARGPRVSQTTRRN